MKKISLFFLLILFAVLSVNANEFPKKNQLNLSFADCPIIYGQIFTHNILLFNLNYNRSINDWCSFGGYVGVGEYKDFIYRERVGGASTTLNEEHLKSINLGVNANIHLLPIIFKPRLSWIDLYVTAKVGTIYLPSNEEPTYPVNYTDFIILPARGTYLDGSLFGGLKLYPTKSVGVFGEYGYRMFEYYKGYHTRFGIAVRF